MALSSSFVHQILILEPITGQLYMKQSTNKKYKRIRDIRIINEKYFPLGFNWQILSIIRPITGLELNLLCLWV